MKSSNPPHLAVWLLEEFGPKVNREALAGDLNEAMAQGRSSAWYWRQVLRAVRWRSSLFRLLLLIAWGWWMTSPSMSGNSALVSRPLDIAIFVAGMLAAGHLPRMLRGRLRALLAVLIAPAVASACTAARMQIGDHPAYVRTNITFTNGTIAASGVAAADPGPSDGSAAVAVSRPAIHTQVPPRAA